MKMFLFFIIITTKVFAQDWCPDKIAVAPVYYENKVQPLFFVAEDLLREFSYTYKARSSTVFCYISLKHKGVQSSINLYPPVKYQKELNLILKKKDISMEDIFQTDSVKYSPAIEKLLEKYKLIRNGVVWNIPIISDKKVSWKTLNELSINDQFSSRINKIKTQYVENFGWDYLYPYYLYIAMRLFIISLLVVGFIFIKIKFSKNI